MAAFTTIAIGVGLALSAAGLGLQAYGQSQAADAQKEAEAARKKQMQLDAARRRRETIREMMQARALALSNVTNSAGGAETSALAGGYGQIAGVAGRNITDSLLNVQLGNTIYDANMKAASGESMAYLGQGVKGFGETLMANNVNIDKLGNTMGLWS